MEQIFSTILNESWIVYLLFFMIVAWFIWKWIPALVSRFDKMNEDFRTSLKEQQETFERTLTKIADDFMSQINQSNSFHEKHSNELKEIKEILKKK